MKEASMNKINKLRKKILTGVLIIVSAPALIALDFILVALTRNQMLAVISFVIIAILGVLSIPALIIGLIIIILNLINYIKIKKELVRKDSYDKKYLTPLKKQKIITLICLVLILGMLITPVLIDSDYSLF